MFGTVCQVGDRTSPVTGYMSKNKNYSSRLKRRRCSHPSQIVCEYEPQNVAAESWSRARAAGGPTLAGCLYPAVFMVGGFFTWLTFNCTRSNISSSKRGIKMDSSSDDSVRAIQLAVYSIMTGTRESGSTC